MGQGVAKVRQPAPDHEAAQGTGLGLAISSKLVERLGGELTLQSRLGHGSAFHFRIPIVACVTHEEVQPKADQTVPDLHGRILVAEDNVTNQHLITIYLKKTGAMVEVVEDGTDAVAAFRKNRYDLILMDENMPRMNGTEAVAEIREIERQTQRPHTPVVALTANAIKGDRERFIGAGMDDYLQKPIDKDALYSLLAHYLTADSAPSISHKKELAVDLAVLASRLEMELDDIKTLLKLFRNTTVESMQTIDENLVKNDLDGIYRGFHKIAGSSAAEFFGMGEMISVAREAENHARAGETDIDYRGYLERLRVIFQRLPEEG